MQAIRAARGARVTRSGVELLASFLPRRIVPAMMLLSVAIGALVGLLVAAFEQLTVEVLLEHLLNGPLWWQTIAPMVGLTTALVILRYLGKGANSSTADEYVRAFHERHPKLPIVQLPAKLLAGMATIGFGGSMGLEGPSVYAGAAVGHSTQNVFSRWLRREETKMLLTAGAAAGIAAVFKTPATGVIFALEAPYRDDVARRALLPALLASAAGYLVYVAILGTDPVIDLGSHDTDLSIIHLGGGALLGLVAGLGGRGFAWLVRQAKGLEQRYNFTIRILLGGMILAGLVLVTDALFEEPLSLGPGVEATEWLRDGDHTLGLIGALLAFRVLATLTTVGAGGTGGLFIPLAVQGVIVGSLVGQTLDVADIGLYRTLGLAAFLAAGYRAPITAVMFVAESTGTSAFVVPALIAAAVSQLVAGRSSVTSYQLEKREGLVERRLALPLTSALTTDTLTVPSDATVSELVYIHLLGRRQREVPVVDSGIYVGMCGLEEISGLERELWNDTLVGDMANANLPVARPSWTLRDVITQMDTHNTDQLAVTDDENTFIGVVRDDEILRLDEILDETEGA
ncbi:MAG: CBS domain-containing protein [Acidimicrobiia bacterium]|nr:CBS domain-containing protein [Acidimicrobiia bacterium]MYC58501.1 CBS domain-containing protein [Acidimicrobiia bacterium]MYG94259.1 CBS domain-containing protein [Acidimicrobiia bacterium]MYI30393.1 CBS domain-containing protein [Acidimicrobiia bacterium]